MELEGFLNKTTLKEYTSYCFLETRNKTSSENKIGRRNYIVTVSWRLRATEYNDDVQHPHIFKNVNKIAQHIKLAVIEIKYSPENRRVRWNWGGVVDKTADGNV